MEAGPSVIYVMGMNSCSSWTGRCGDVQDLLRPRAIELSVPEKSEPEKSEAKVCLQEVLRTMSLL